MLTTTRLCATACAVLVATALPAQSANAGTPHHHRHLVKPAVRVLRGLPYVAKPARRARPDAAKGRVKSSSDEPARRTRRASRRRLVKPAVAPLIAAPTGPAPNMLASQGGPGPTARICPSEVGASDRPALLRPGVHPPG